MDSTCSASFANCSETFGEAPLAFERLGRVASRRHPGWVIRHLSNAVPGRQWRAQTQRPLTLREITLGRKGAFHASSLNGLESRLRAQRLSDFLTATRSRGWRR